MKIKEADVKTFIYEGKDTMINFNSDKIPKCPKAFIAKLKLYNGKVITAPQDWRDKIWKWWHEARKDELQYKLLMRSVYDARAGHPRRNGYRLDEL